MSFSEVNVQRRWNSAEIRENFVMNLSKEENNKNDLRKFSVTRDDLSINILQYSVNYIKDSQSSAFSFLFSPFCQLSFPQKMIRTYQSEEAKITRCIAGK